MRLKLSIAVLGLSVLSACSSDGLFRPFGPDGIFRSLGYDGLLRPFASKSAIRPFDMEFTEVNGDVFSGIAGSQFTMVVIAQRTGRAVCSSIPLQLMIIPNDDGSMSFQGKC